MYTSTSEVCIFPDIFITERIDMEYSAEFWVKLLLFDGACQESVSCLR